MKNNVYKTINTLTLDNDSAFALYEKIENQMDTKIYFCELYKSYQKGPIENANKLLRTKLPRTTLIDHFEQSEIDNIVRKIE